MVIGLLQGVEVDYNRQQQTDIAIQRTVTNMVTNTVSPTIAPQYTLGYSPQLVFSSPQAKIGAGVTQNPTVSPLTSITPTADTSPSITQTPSMTAEQGGGNTMMDYALAGVAIIAGIIIIPKLLKTVSKTKTGGLI